MSADYYGGTAAASVYYPYYRLFSFYTVLYMYI